MWIKEYFKDPAVWLAIIAVFALLVFTEGCGPLRFTDKGVRFEQPITDTLSVKGKGKVKSLKKWQVQITLRKTFNTEDLWQ